MANSWCAVGDGRDDRYLLRDPGAGVDGRRFVGKAHERDGAAAADEVNGLLDGRRDAGALKDDIRTEAASSLGQFSRHVLLARVEDAVSAEFDSEGGALGHRLDNKHATSAGGAGALECQQSDGAGADNGNGVAEPDVGAAGGVEGDGQRLDHGRIEVVEALGDRGQTADVGGDGRGEAAVGRAHEAAELAGAVAGVAGAAGGAVATGGGDAADDAVTLTDIGDASANGRDFAHPLVPANGGIPEDA